MALLIQGLASTLLFLSLMVMVWAKLCSSPVPTKDPLAHSPSRCNKLTLIRCLGAGSGQGVYVAARQPVSLYAPALWSPAILSCPHPSRLAGSHLFPTLSGLHSPICPDRSPHVLLTVSCRVTHALLSGLAFCPKVSICLFSPTDSGILVPAPTIMDSYKINKSEYQRSSSSWGLGYVSPGLRAACAAQLSRLILQHLFFPPCFGNNFLLSSVDDQGLVNPSTLATGALLGLHQFRATTCSCSLDSPGAAEFRPLVLFR